MPGVPTSTTSPSTPINIPPVAPVASTAVSTIARSSWSVSCVAASASPKRETASRSRWRSDSSSSSRYCSWSAIWLNALPSLASSSRPRTGTRSSYFPRAIAFAAFAMLDTVRTTERPSTYATSAIRMSAASNPISSRCWMPIAAASIASCGATTPSVGSPECPGVAATRTRCRLPPIETVVGRSAGTSSGAWVHPAPTTSLPPCTTTNCSFSPRPDRCFALRRSSWSNGTDAITKPSNPAGPSTRTRRSAASGGRTPTWKSADSTLTLRLELTSLCAAFASPRSRARCMRRSFASVEATRSAWARSSPYAVTAARSPDWSRASTRRTSLCFATDVKPQNAAAAGRSESRPK